MSSVTIITVDGEGDRKEHTFEASPQAKHFQLTANEIIGLIETAMTRGVLCGYNCTLCSEHADEYEAGLDEEATDVVPAFNTTDLNTLTIGEFYDSWPRTKD